MSAILYPQVSSVRPQGQAEKAAPKQNEAAKAEFDQALGQAMEAKADLSQVRNPLKFSAHAAQRLADRKIQLDAATMAKVNDAIDKAAAKGIEDTLVLTQDAALIVSVKNKTVITALDKNSMSGNVFTNIDGAVIV